MVRYSPAEDRYEKMQYRICGASGLKLPAISIGLWHNFGGTDDFSTANMSVRKAFDCGITHFDLANNYGMPPGSAEENFGRILKKDLLPYRDELIISTKAGYRMWPGPYGDWGSRKYLISSLDQSLRRMHLDYVDIFYHHRPDPETPLEEAMQALDHIVRSGKALYAGISSYPPALTVKAAKMLKELGTPCLIHQVRYNILDRMPENGLLEVLEKERIGCIVFSPLAQGVLTNRYFNGIPSDSRAAKPHGFLHPGDITEEKLSKTRKLNLLAEKRDQSLAQMSLAWLLNKKEITSVLIGVSSSQQVVETVGTLKNLTLTREELEDIENITKK
ncbi:MAG: aldo/keto reductase [Bacteroidota bacterium]